MGAIRNAHKIFVGKPAAKWPHGRYRRRWQDNIKTVLREIGWWSVDWMHVAQDGNQWRAVVNTVMNLWVQ
jgi:hypothetical protein